MARRCVARSSRSALAALALHIAARRDLGDGLLAHRPGRSGAASWITGPVALAWRLDRTSLLAWADRRSRCSGAFEGALLSDVGPPRGGQRRPHSPARAPRGRHGRRPGRVPGGPDRAVRPRRRRLRHIHARCGCDTEEEDGRAEVVLTSPRTRVAWMAGHGSIALVGSLLLLVVGGLSLGLRPRRRRRDAARAGCPRSCRHAAQRPGRAAARRGHAALFGVAASVRPRSVGRPRRGACSPGSSARSSALPEWLPDLAVRGTRRRWPGEAMAWAAGRWC